MVTTNLKLIFCSALLLQTNSWVLVLALSGAASKFCSTMSGVTILAKQINKAKKNRKNCVVEETAPVFGKS